MNFNLEAKKSRINSRGKPATGSKMVVETNPIDSPKIPEHSLCIAMIGSVANGKTSLVKALSGEDTAKFKKEKKLNMTIRLGYADFSIFRCPRCPPLSATFPSGALSKSQRKSKNPRCPNTGCDEKCKLVRHVSMLDSPGHHELISTMLSGAAIVDACIIVASVDSNLDEGSNARFHIQCAQAAGLLQPNKCIIVQNKVDLRTIQQCAMHSYSLQDVLRYTGAANAPIIPTSAHHKIGIDSLCRVLAGMHIRTTRQADKNATSYAIASVVRSFDINRPGTEAKHIKGGVLGGTIQSGQVSIGDSVEIRPGLLHRDGSYTPIHSTVNTLRCGDSSLTTARPGGLVAFGLGIDPALTREDRMSGQIIGTSKALPPVFQAAEIKITFFDRKGVPPKKGEVVKVLIGHSVRRARVRKILQLTKSTVLLRVRMLLAMCGTCGSRAAILRQEAAQGQTYSILGFGTLERIQLAKQTPMQSRSLPITESKDNDQIRPLSPEHTTAKFSLTDATTRNATFEKKLSGSKEKKAVCFDTKSRLYPNEYPMTGDLVLARFEREVAGAGTYVTLPEYGGIKGLLPVGHSSKERRGKPFPKRGDVVVKVIRAGPNGVDLTRRRIDDEDEEDCLSWYRKSCRLRSLLSELDLFIPMIDSTTDTVAREISRLQQVMETIAHPLYTLLEETDDPVLHPVDVLQAAAIKNNVKSISLMKDLPISNGNIQALYHIIRKRMTSIKPIKISAEITLACFEGGVGVIRNALASCKLPEGVRFTLKAPPLYLVEIETQNVSLGKATIVRTLRVIKAIFSKQGGECQWDENTWN